MDKGAIPKQSEIISHIRVVSSFHNHQCPECKTEFTTGTEAELPMPYCGNCGKIVLDITQKFCCWCGSRYVEEEPTQ